MTSNYKITLSILLAFICQIAFGQTNGAKLPYPNVVGLTLKEAKIALGKTKFEIGAIVYEPNAIFLDTLIIYKQNPPTINDQGDTNYVKEID